LRLGIPKVAFFFVIELSLEEENKMGMLIVFRFYHHLLKKVTMALLSLNDLLLSHRSKNRVPISGDRNLVGDQECILH
jgi:hypothetical protein